jgi:hypothetical protein
MLSCVLACVTMAQIPGAVGFGGARLVVPDPDPATVPAPLPELMRRCFAAPAERPTATAVRAALEEALRRATGPAADPAADMPDEYKCPITFEPMRDPVAAQDGRSYGKPS